MGRSTKTRPSRRVLLGVTAAIALIAQAGIAQHRRRVVTPAHLKAAHFLQVTAKLRFPPAKTTRSGKRPKTPPPRERESGKRPRPTGRKPTRQRRPPPKPAPLARYRLGVIGNCDVAKLLRSRKHLAVSDGKRTVRRELELVSVSVSDLVVQRDRLRKCNAIWLSPDLGASVYQQVIKAFASQPILLASDRRGFAAAGGTLQPFVTGRRVKFEINKAALDRAGLSISSRVLRLSERAPR